jgi:hypothetical protein
MILIWQVTLDISPSASKKASSPRQRRDRSPSFGCLPS